MKTTTDLDTQITKKQKDLQEKSDTLKTTTEALKTGLDKLLSSFDESIGISASVIKEHKLTQPSTIFAPVSKDLGDGNIAKAYQLLTVKIAEQETELTLKLGEITKSKSAIDAQNMFLGTKGAFTTTTYSPEQKATALENLKKLQPLNEKLHKDEAGIRKELEKLNQFEKVALEQIRNLEKNKAKVNKLKREEQDLKKEVEKLEQQVLEREQRKIFQDIISKATIEAVNASLGVETTKSVEDIAKSVGDVTEGIKGKLTPDQLQELKTNLSVLRGQIDGVENSKGLMSSRESLLEAIKKEVDKGVDLMKSDPSFKMMQGELEKYKKSQYHVKKDDLDSLKLQKVDDKLQWVGNKPHAGNLNDKLAEDSKLQAANEKFMKLVDGSIEATGAKPSILDAISAFILAVKQFLGFEVTKDDLTLQQKRAAQKVVAQKVVGKHTKGLQVDKGKEKSQVVLQ